ncbi:phage GP46 family protein [Moritella sp. F3]|uniref:phage GP46 family protein n=1 Tax=Moritella sp. F3 TaxID=2718882 RepID=UPI0018E0F751|nr:phage GP46 family protein [Moritella sp. F3]GIC79486.1 hypothetical protein FMO001_42130 [Moritella sp. F1]GIC79764.1 hypothetical protein FMO003_00450 [Moritella sp. F3]
MSHFNLTALTLPLTTNDGLIHAVLQSVLNHALSTGNDRARMENTERGGCWSDEFINGVGSRDWTLKREKLTEQTMKRATLFYEDALAWLVNEKHVQAVTIDVFKSSPTMLSRKVILTLNNGVKLEITP